jgi:hypothetical protein
MATPASSTSNSTQREQKQQQVNSLQAFLSPSAHASNNASSAISDSDTQFSPLSISIPTDSLLDDAFMAGFSFSKRGSLMFGGKRATMPSDGATDLSTSAAALADGNNNASEERPASLDRTISDEASHERPSPSLSAADTSHRAAIAHPIPDIRILSPDIEQESQKVRSLYQTGDAINWEDGARFSFCEHLEPTLEVPAEEDSQDPYAACPLATQTPLFALVRDFANFVCVSPCVATSPPYRILGYLQPGQDP